MRKIVLASFLLCAAALLISCGGSTSSSSVTPPPSAPPKKAAFVYAVDSTGYDAASHTNTNVLETLKFDSNSGTLSFASGSPIALSGFDSASPVLSADSSHLYIYGVPPCCDAPPVLQVYVIDPSTGEPGLAQTITLASSSSGGISVDPRGRFVYVSGWDGAGSQVNAYAVQADGKLNFSGTSSVKMENNSGFVSPDGRYFYTYTDKAVGNWQDSAPSGPGLTTFWQYAIDPSSGMLAQVSDGGSAQISRTLYVMGRDATNRLTMRFAPDGAWAFAVDHENGSVTVLGVNASSGTMMVLSSTISKSPVQYVDSGLDPKGRFLYVTVAAGISGFVLPASGSNTLSAIPLTPLAQNAEDSLQFTEPIVDAYGAFLLVDEFKDGNNTCCQGNDEILVYRIDSSSGTLTPSGSPTTLHGAGAQMVVTIQH